MKDRLLNVTEVCLLVGVSQQTIYYWYAFKKANPKNKYAKLLPKYSQKGDRGKRFWKQSDIPKLIEFKVSIPKGRAGILGDITQKYYRPRKEKDGGNT